MNIKTFSKIFIGVIIVIVFVGIILPILISAKHTELVVVGFTIIAGAIYFAGRHLIRLSENNKEKQDEEN